MLLMQIKLIYNRWKLDLIPLLFSFLYISAEDEQPDRIILHPREYNKSQAL